MKSTFRITGIFQLVMGTGMIGIWVGLFLSKQIPELQTDPFQICMHILAEIVTALLLLISGSFILLKKYRHPIFFNLSFGMLIYTPIASQGYYVQQSDWGPVALFMVLLAMTAGLLIVTRIKK